MNRTIRILSAALLIVPSLAQAAYYPTSYGPYSRAMFTQTVMDRTGGARDGTHCFPDVGNQSYAPAVCAAKLQGIVSGGADGYFLPDAPIAFVEAAAIALRADGFFAPSGSPWYRGYLEELSDRDAIPVSVSNILDPITSSQAEELMTAVFNGTSTSNNNNKKNKMKNNSNQKDDNDDEIDLSIDVSDNTVEPDDTVTFRIRLKNVDNDDLENVEVVATFDEDEFEFVSASDSGDLQSNDEDVEWDSIDVDEDETKTILLTLRVNEDADEGDRLDIQVEVEDSKATGSVRIEEDDDRSNNDDDAVKLTITDSPDPVEPGESIRYTIKIENMEDDDISVDIRAILDPQVDFISASNNGDEERNEVVWTNIDLDEDEDQTVTLTVRVDNGADDGDSIRLEVQANDDEDTETTRVDDDNDDDDDDDDTGDEDIKISITDSDDPVEIGDTVEYRITLENNENDNVSIDVVAELDEGMSFLDASNGGDEESDDKVRWENIKIEEDDDRTITLKVRINSKADDGDTLRLRIRAGDGDEDETTKVED